MTWFRLELANKITKIINTKTISTVYQNKNHLTITYNYTSTRSFLLFGTGVIEKEPHSETFTYDNTIDAQKVLDEIQKTINK